MSTWRHENWTRQFLGYVVSVTTVSGKTWVGTCQMFGADTIEIEVTDKHSVWIDNTHVESIEMDTTQLDEQ